MFDPGLTLTRATRSPSETGPTWADPLASQRECDLHGNDDAITASGQGRLAGTASRVSWHRSIAHRPLCFCRLHVQLAEMG